MDSWCDWYFFLGFSGSTTILISAMVGADSATIVACNDI